MKILYVYRHPDLGYSIGKVFHSIENEMKKYADIDSIYLPVSNYSIKGLWKNIKYVQKYCKNIQYDIIHITGTENYLIPFLEGHKIVVTVHDLGSIATHNPIKNFFKNIIFIKTLKFADLITCISDKTKSEILGVISGVKNKVVTIHNPIFPEYQYMPKCFNEKNPIILHIGTRPNKNLENTIKALTGIKCRLRIIGELFPDIKNSLLKANIDYTNTCGLSDEDILKEYENCDFVNFPSLYEGFGMPIIEGQSVGRPVLTSNLSPMKEVAGNSAVLVNPYDISSIRLGYKELMKNHQIYVERGLKNSCRFQLQEIVLQYLDNYKTLIKK